MIVQTLNLILLTYYELHCLCTILDQSFPLKSLEEEGGVSEQKIRLEGDGDGRDGNGAKNASLFRCWYYNHVNIFSIYLLAHAYLVEFQMVKSFHIWM